MYIVDFVDDVVWRWGPGPCPSKFNIYWRSTSIYFKGLTLHSYPPPQHFSNLCRSGLAYFLFLFAPQNIYPFRFIFNFFKKKIELGVGRYIIYRVYKEERWRERFIYYDYAWLMYSSKQHKLLRQFGITIKITLFFYKKIFAEGNMLAENEYIWSIHICDDACTAKMPIILPYYHMPWCQSQTCISESKWATFRRIRAGYIMKIMFVETFSQWTLHD